MILDKRIIKEASEKMKKFIPDKLSGKSCVLETILIYNENNREYIKNQINKNNF